MHIAAAPLAARTPMPRGVIDTIRDLISADEVTPADIAVRLRSCPEIALAVVRAWAHLGVEWVSFAAACDALGPDRLLELLSHMNAAPLARDGDVTAAQRAAAAQDAARCAALCGAVIPGPLGDEDLALAATLGHMPRPALGGLGALGLPLPLVEAALRMSETSVPTSPAARAVWLGARLARARGTGAHPARFLDCAAACEVTPVHAELLWFMNAPAPAPCPLSRRERELLRALARGVLVKQAAHQLSISTSTAHNHLFRIYRKLDTRGLVQTLDLCRRQGWV